MNAKISNRRLNPKIHEYLAIEGISYLSKQAIYKNEEVKEFLKKHPVALQRRALLLNEKLQGKVRLDDDGTSAAKNSTGDEGEEDEDEE